MHAFADSSSDVNLSSAGGDAVTTAFGTNVNGVVHYRISREMDGFIDPRSFDLLWAYHSLGPNAVELGREPFQKCGH